jgi:hypothetical protein
MKRREHLRVVRLSDATTTSMESPVLSADEENTTASMVQDDWYEKVCKRLTEIGKLLPGWDGYKAPGISSNTVHFASLLLGSVSAEARPLSLPAVTPMSSGAIMIEWRTRTHELTVEVNNINNVDVMLEVLATGQVEEFEVESDFARISDALEQSTKPVVAVA